MTFEEKTGFIRQRCLEMAFVVLVSSVPLYLLVVSGVLSSTKAAYIAIFGASSAIFLALSSVVLYRHFWAVDFDIRKYIMVNFSITAVLMAGNYITIIYALGGHLDMALFGYTTPLRPVFQTFGVSDTASAVWSATVFWLIYIVLIALVVVKVFFFDGRYRDYLQQMEEQESLESQESWKRNNN